MEKATFAAGCFWGVEETFRCVNGVISTRVGYIGGNKENPTYEEVCSHTTGHAEAVEVEYNEEIINYQELLKVFFESHDPTQLNKQGSDIGDNYRSAIFYHNQDQKESAEIFKEELEKSKKYKDPIVTQIVEAPEFYEAEVYHQKYLLKRGKRQCKI